MEKDLKTPLEEKRIKHLSPLSLAWLGDAVYSLYVRKSLMLKTPKKTDALHRLSVSAVNAHAQATAVRALMEDFLTENEIRFVKKGKNAVKNVPKSSSLYDYGDATGFETLLGYLYLKGDNDRLEQVMAKALEITDY